MVLPASTQSVVAEFARRGFQIEILESSQSTRTAAEAAASLGTGVAQIVKSLLFLVGERPVLALMSGVNRLDEEKLSRYFDGAKVVRANADQVRAATGFVIGGVPPIALSAGLAVLCDDDLLQYPIVFAAAGSPHHNFAIEPRRLVELAEATTADLKLETPT